VLPLADDRPADWFDGRHPDCPVEEWVFAGWTGDGRLGVVSGHRIVGRTAWYWAALAREGRPLLHIADFEVPVRADPFIVKGEALWAEHHCDAEMEQWSIGNETYASAITRPRPRRRSSPPVTGPRSTTATNRSASSTGRSKSWENGGWS